MTVVNLREWRRSDAAALAAVVGDPEVLKWSQIAELGVEPWIAEEQKCRSGPSRAVSDPDDGRVLGRVALRLPGLTSAATAGEAVRPADRPVGELGYWLLPDARGRGVATAAVLAMLNVARQLNALRSVLLDIEIDNHASIRVAERVGAARREPVHIAPDRQGVARTLACFVITL